MLCIVLSQRLDSSSRNNQPLFVVPPAHVLLESCMGTRLLLAKILRGSVQITHTVLSPRAIAAVLFAQDITAMAFAQGAAAACSFDALHTIMREAASLNRPWHCEPPAQSFVVEFTIFCLQGCSHPFIRKSRFGVVSLQHRGRA